MSGEFSMKSGTGEAAWFKDHEHGPEMVLVPTGRFTMGSPADEPEREFWQKGTESPQHECHIARPLAVGRHAVTRAQFSNFVRAQDYCIADGAFAWTGSAWSWDERLSWRNPGFSQDDDHPVVCVNWADANAYASWLSATTGRHYRLPTEAEREYVTRAGAETPFWWGCSIDPEQANYECTSVYAGGGAAGNWRRTTTPVGCFEANPWGLYSVHGNVREWCQDLWHDSYVGAPDDGSAWIDGGDASRRTVRGGCWDYGPMYLRSAYRDWSLADSRATNLGFRLIRELSAA